MKLRNKKTGEKVKCSGLIESSEGTILLSEISLDEINEMYEDYKEPLIKNEKVRKAVKAWAEVNNLCSLTVHKTYSNEFWYLRGNYREEESIDLDMKGGCPKELFNNSSYSIEELCGGENENQ